MVTQSSNRVRIHTDHSALGDIVNVAFDRYLAAGRRDEHFFLAVVYAASSRNPVRRRPD
ncbi:hypothetical protein [Haloarcula sebkhae]|uniref:hypothetical protein n=1 Tax=Haloarcula sebkhae TaxID=932660 RepID=UPI0036F26B32